MFKKILIFITITIFTLSCTDNENAIFYYLENEEVEIDHSLNNEISISHMDMDASNNIYIAAGTSAYRYGTSWNGLSFPSGTDFITSLIVFNVSGTEYLFGGFKDGGSFEFWRGNIGADSPTWTQIDDPNNLIDGKQIIRLKELNNRIVAITYQSGNYNIYFSELNGTTFNNTNMPAQTSQILDIIEGAAGAYWAITPTKIYSGPTIDALTTERLLADGDIPNTSDKFRGVHYSAGTNKYYISTDDGQVFESLDNNGNNWNASDTKDVSNKNVPFALFAEINGNILVGTFGYGYYEMIGGSVDNLNRLGEFTSADLYDGVVVDFYINGNTCYFLTAGSGLWRNTYTIADGWGSDWEHE